MNRPLPLLLFLLVLFFCRPPAIMAQGWQWAVSNNGSSGGGYIQSIATDPFGDLLFTGYMFSDSIKFGDYTIIDTNRYGDWNFFIGKNNSSGRFLWALGSQNTPNNNNDVMPVRIVSDQNGNSYLFGVYSPDGYDSTWTIGNVTLYDPYYNSYHSEYFLAKFDPSGNVTWAQNVVPNAWGISNFEEGDLAIDPTGNVYVTGAFASPSITIGNTTLTNNGINGPDIFIAKFDSYGNAIWAKSFGGIYDDGFSKLAYSGSGYIYLSGWYQSPSIVIGNTTLLTDSQPNGDGLFFLAKLDSSGNVDWAENLYDNANYIGMAADESGDVYMTGNFNGDSLIAGIDTVPDNASVSFLFVKYNPDGSVSWVRSIPGNDTINYGGMSLAVDACDNIYLTGYFENMGNKHVDSVNFNGFVLPVPPNKINDYFIVDYDPGGNCLSGILASSQSDFAPFNAIVTDNNGNYYISGSFQGAFNLGSNNFFYNDTIHYNDSDIYIDSEDSKLFIAKYTYISPLDYNEATTTSGICPGSPTTLQGPPGFLNYVWNDSTTGIDKTITKAGQYSVNCTNICTGKAETEIIEVSNEDCNTCISFPNAFTPSGTGVNSVFRPVVKPWCNLTLYGIHIYDRWGKQVFATNDPTVGWNGTFEGIPQDMGTYMYMAEYRDQVGYTVYQLKGDLILIR